MRRSTDRILTTHAGSLPRPAPLLDAAQRLGWASEQLAGEVDAAVDDAVRRQVEAGLDLVNDGEQSKPDYSTYIRLRLSGLEGEAEHLPTSRDARAFPEFFARSALSSMTWPCCTGPIEWRDFGAVTRDIDRLKGALARAGRAPQDGFMTAVSPGQAARFIGNRYYKSHGDYLHALGEALKAEYDAIAAAGFTLQVDCPDLASGWSSQFVDATVAEFREVVKLHLEVLDEATRDVPPEQLRIHLCWGNYPGPHTQDIPLERILDLVLASRASAISLEGANPRHEHEWRAFRDVALPDGKIVIPGVIDSVSLFVEHPRVVADRIVRYAEVVGKEKVVAGVDCGFATLAGGQYVHPSVVWAKLAALVEGARLASEELWT